MEKKIQARTPAEAIAHGLAYVTEDRKGEGLMLEHSILMNLSLSNLKRVGNGRTINHEMEMHEGEKLREGFHIKASDLTRAVGNLSGGNQQKVMLAKWVLRGAGGADPRRTHARHRRGRQVRGLYHHQPACRHGQARIG